MVARPERDTDEGNVLLERDLGDRRERAVAARHPEHVRSGLARDLLDVLALLEDAHLHAALDRGQAQLVGVGRGRSGARIDDQVSLQRVRSRRLPRWAVRPMYPPRSMSIIQPMSERGLHMIEDDLSETWIEDWAGVGLRELEALLAKHDAFRGFLETVDD